MTPFKLVTLRLTLIVAMSWRATKHIHLDIQLVIALITNTAVYFKWRKRRVCNSEGVVLNIYISTCVERELTRIGGVACRKRPAAALPSSRTKKCRNIGDYLSLN